MFGILVGITLVIVAVLAYRIIKGHKSVGKAALELKDEVTNIAKTDINAISSSSNTEASVAAAVAVTTTLPTP